MDGPRFTVSSSAVAALVRYGETRGVASARLLRAHGLDKAALDNVDLRIPQAVNNALFDALVEATGDQDLGLHLAEHADVQAWDVLMHLAMRSPTLGVALERIARYSRFVHDAGRVEVERSASAVTVFPGCRGLLHEFPRQVAEYAAASTVLSARALAGDVRVLRVDFRHARPAHGSAEHVRLLGVEPHFGCAETAVVLEPRAWDAPVASADAGLASLLERYARDLVDRLASEDDLMAQVEHAISVALEDGPPTLQSVARTLGMGPRTLQRRLDALETSFQQLLDSVRRTCAARYVAGSAFTLQEVAFLLGFGDASNFHRAFKRWYGVTPGAYRASPPSP